MGKGRLSDRQDQRQGSVEGVMGSLGVALALLDHDKLRVEQAIRRGGFTDLLQPVVIDYFKIAQNIKDVQETLRGEWENGQSNKWE
jgi:hypothetical protein